jgi:hypothetical protein
MDQLLEKVIQCKGMGWKKERKMERERERDEERE